METVPPDGSAQPLEVRRLALGPFQSNCYFLRRAGSDQMLLVDPGAEAERVESELHEWRSSPAAILLTHAHLDHLGAVAELLDRFEVPVYLHPAGRLLYDRASEQAEAFGLHVRQPPPPDHELTHGQRLELAGLELEVRHAPGHSPGGVILLTDGYAFVGDCIFAGSIGRTDLPGGNLALLLSSIREQILTLAPDTILYSGHGPETTVAHEAASNPFLAGVSGTRPLERCLRCGSYLPARVMGCRGEACPKCGHLYPHGDCSD